MFTQLWQARQPLLIVQFGAMLSGAIGFAVNLIALEEMIDRPLAQFFQAQSDSVVFIIAATLTDFGKAHWFLIPAAVLFLAFRFVWRRPHWACRALFVFVSVAASGLLADVLKVAFGRARPKLLFSDEVYQFFFFRLGADYYSFPSGHAVCAAAAGTAMAVILPRYRALWALLALLLISTRVIITAHYFSDVVASTALAVVIVFAIKAAFTRHGLDLATDVGPHAVGGGQSAIAAKIIGAHGTETFKAQTSQPQLDDASSLIAMITAAIAIVGAVLAVNLFVVEWLAPDYRPIPDWWLWVPLVLCLAFGAALGRRLYSKGLPND